MLEFLDPLRELMPRAVQKALSWKQVQPYVAAALILLVSYIAARNASRLAQLAMRKRASEHRLVVAQKLLHFGILTLGVILALNQLGIRLSSLLAAAGIFTVALGFAAQTSVSNVISGFFLFFDRPFSINDTVRIDQHTGTVVSIDLLSTRLRTFDNLMVRIPNEALLKSTIINYTLHAVRRVDIAISVAHGMDCRQAQEVLLGVVQDHELVLREPRPVVLADMLMEMGTQFVVRAWVDSEDYIAAKSDLILSLEEALRHTGLELGHPRRLVSFGAAPAPSPDQAGASDTASLQEVRHAAHAAPNAPQADPV